jgi:hypothetical protein
VIRITGLFEVGGEVTGVLESPRELVASLHETPDSEHHSASHRSRRGHSDFAATVSAIWPPSSRSPAGRPTKGDILRSVVVVKSRSHPTNLDYFSASDNVK